ncbi:MAG: prephenate dehydratase [Burkholderiales bacterium]|nr:prephenate dehydratase [Burkholderiales bacterium]
MSEGDSGSRADPIAEHRAAIDALDAELVRLVNERARHAAAIGRLKGGAPAYRPEREADILRRAAAANPGPVPDEALGRILAELISACRALEEPLRIAYLGPPGTFSEMAVAKQFGGSVETVALDTIDEVFRAAETGAVGFAVIPVENSSEGAVGISLDLLLATPLRICAEIVLRVHQNLLAAQPTPKRIGRVYSHAQSLAQCRGWLARHLPQAERVAVASNAEAARRAAAEADACAIGPALAAQRYELAIVAPNIEDDPRNMTRFAVLGGLAPDPSGRDRTSLVMSVPNRPGALHALLSPLARHAVSMTRIESRPSRQAVWEYMFFVDVEGHATDVPVAAALAELRGIAPFLKILGSYPSAAP